jgi:hypothetical protein
MTYLSEQPETVTVFPTIGNWPLSQFKEFKDFAHNKAGGTYWVAIMLLMERSKRLEAYEGQTFSQEETEDEPEPEKPLTLGD